MTPMFISHGSPMIALTTNQQTQSLANWAKTHPLPDLIVAISAHWITPKLSATSTSRHQTLYDFGGFSKELYEITYEPPGKPEFVDEIQAILDTPITKDPQRKLDHGVWTVLKWLYPKADIPLIQLSLEAGISLQDHFNRGQNLSKLPGNILLFTTGNLTHNLSEIQFGDNPKPVEWALEFDHIIKTAIEQQDWETLISPDTRIGDLFWQAHPTIEHYVPLLYAAGCAQALNQKPVWLHEGFEMGTLSMRSIVWE